MAASDSGLEDKAKVKPLRKARRGVNDVLVPTYIAEPLPVPDWLGQPVVLNRLSTCPLCQRPLKKSESGPARWVSDLTRPETVETDDSDTSRRAFLRYTDRQTTRRICAR